MVTESSNLSLSAKQEYYPIMMNETILMQVRAALATHPRASLAWDRLPPSHRRQYLKWVSEAKRETTRDKRIAKMLQMILDRA